jgi:AbrB family looped-hinge helix DNA binding protein
MQTHVTSKGQIVIPSELRKKYRITPGTRFEVIDDGEQIILRPITPEFVRSLRGYLKGSGALKILEQERLAERES